MIRTKHTARKAPPSPPGHFLLGNLLELRRNELAFMTQMFQAHGEVVRLRWFLSDDYVITHPDYVQYILQDNKDNYLSTRTKDYTMTQRVFGHGLSALEGDAWLRRRRLLQPVFHSR